MTTTVDPNYWSLLGVSPECDSNELKSAFRKEARKWHPDLNKNDVNAEERFKLINEAYAILSDPKKRREWEKKIYKEKDIFENRFPSYEEYLDVVLGIKTNIENEDDIESQFVDLTEDEYKNFDESEIDFNQNIPATSEPSPPPTLIYEDQESIVEITPEQALYGSSVDIQLQDGTLVEVLTPPFAGDGWRLRIEGAAIGCRDHFVQLKVQTDDGLRVDGLRVMYRLELFPHDALLGCAVDIPTLNGNVTLQVPPNSSTGRLLRLRGRGLEYEDYRGDQIVEIIIVLPDSLSDSEIALYQRLNEISLEKY
ncbi:DnaJ domain-containing protein [Prochlorococcus marinus]|uniref:Molecular chaperone DnaJ n=1 Tax=Prochlorococcus marinus XMU1408 TaxID=2213228 RepID=A0A318RB55_PROMR|nr:DnaJ domain-containing protein [Prochlorococcus marinus]MBW3041942.1 molecular chaperone DnaJ [Prochlorococcus marinus str. XMU1408]PYE03069.1 molecular chaperone DnaJ [Prochlorococcus marinus XMU1408]